MILTDSELAQRRERFPGFEGSAEVQRAQRERAGMVCGRKWAVTRANLQDLDFIRREAENSDGECPRTREIAIRDCLGDAHASFGNRGFSDWLRGFALGALSVLKQAIECTADELEEVSADGH